MCSTRTAQCCVISNNAILHVFIKARRELYDAEESSVDSKQITTSLDPGVYDDKRGYSRTPSTVSIITTCASIGSKKVYISALFI